MQLRYGSHIGRVGALAVALGIGTATAAPAGVAWAAPDEQATTSSPSDSNPGSTETDTSANKPASDVQTATEPAIPKTPTDSPRSVMTADDDSAPKPRKKNRTATTQVRTAGTALTSSRKAERPRLEPTAAGAAPETAPAVDAPVAVTATRLSVTTVPAAPAAKPVVVNPVQAVANLIGSVLRPALSTVLGVLPGGSPGSPLAWVLLAAARRQVGRTEPGIAALTVAAAVVNAPPTATVVWGRPDATTGTVIGQLTARDPEGAAVAVTVVPSPIPVPGTVAYNAAARTITYTPTTAQRFAASTSAGDDSVTITLRVTDAVNKVDVPISIPVSPVAVL